MIITNIKNLLPCKENILRRGNYIINLLYKFGIIKSPQMKILYLLIMITGFVTFKGNCQEYIPFPTDTAQWNQLSFHQISGEDYWEVRYSYRMMGDTIIDNQAYNKVYYHWGAIELAEYIGGMREDANKNIYFYPAALNTSYILEFPYDTAEMLLYSFDSLYVGKQLPINEEVNDITVVAIDSVLMGNQYHKRYQITGTQIWGPEYWIEGIGSTSELFSPFTYEFEWEYYMLCFQKDKESAVLVNTEYTEPCEYPSAVIEIKKESIAFVPNPVSDKLSITNSFSGLYEVNVFNIFGQQVGKFNCSNDSSVIDLSGLRSGIYFLMVKSEERVFSGKVVKE